jgi:hypothetical protein
MSDWTFLNKHRVRDGIVASTDADGFNGAFCFVLNGLQTKCIVSDGMGWEHVSVSIHNSRNTPSWQMMCKVKALFWDDEATVIQLHPPQSQWVNNHAGCLHLWRCIDGREFPLPPAIMVGKQEWGDVTA